MRVLVLDDELARHMVFKQKLIGHLVTHVATAQEAIDALKEWDFHYAFLDHDLGGKIMVASGDGTGYEVAKWLSEHPDRQPKMIILHSFNPAGRANMKAILPNAIEFPGVWTAIEPSGGTEIKVNA